MTNVIKNSLLGKYLKSLAEDESSLEEAAEVYETAKAGLEVGLRRYTALRDFVTEKLGKSPYARDCTEVWHPTGYDPDGEPYWAIRGQFRFTGMPVGEAVLQILLESGERNDPWLTLPKIIEELSVGGLGFPEPVQARAVNAALMRTSGIERSEATTGATIYRYVEEVDLPFE